MGDDWKSAAFVYGSCAGFHFATLEEYYVGGLFLQIGNAISDGSVLYVILMTITMIVGPETYKTIAIPAGYLYSDQPNLSIITCFSIFSNIVQIGGIFANLIEIRKVIKKEQYKEFTI